MTALRLHSVLVAALAVAVAGAFAAPGPVQERVVIGWDAGVLVYLVVTGIRLVRAGSAESIQSRAAALDQAGSAVLPLSIIAAATVLSAVVAVAAGAKTDAEAESGAILVRLQHRGPRARGEPGANDVGGLTARGWSARPPCPRATKAAGSA